MINTVLLQGFLSKERLDRALAEIIAIDNNSDNDDNKLVLVISSGGGDTLAAVIFVKAVRQHTDITNIEMKLYEASSVAAFIVLSFGDYDPIIEMEKTAVLGIHRGEIRLSPSQISPFGQVDENLLVNFKEYDSSLVVAMKESGLTDSSYLSELYATDWLRLSAEECLRRGIVERLF